VQVINFGSLEIVRLVIKEKIPDIIDKIKNVHEKRPAETWNRAIAVLCKNFS
jgi:hypothetical protein